MNEECLTSLIQQLVLLEKFFPGLEYGVDKEDDCLFVTGVLNFSASYNEIEIRDSYLIRVNIPWNFNVYHHPIAYEIGGRIPSSFHHYKGGNLCLGLYTAIFDKLLDDCSLLAFFRNILIPYLYAFSYYEKYGRMPFGNFGHDKDAMILYFQDKLNGISSERLLDFLVYMYLPSVYGSHRECLCGSKLPLRYCHLQLVVDLGKRYPRALFKRDIVSCVHQLSEQDIRCNSKISQKNYRLFVRTITRDYKDDLHIK